MSDYSHCSKFTLPCDIQEFILLFWEDAEQHRDFLQVAMHESNIVISPWSNIGKDALLWDFFPSQTPPVPTPAAAATAGAESGVEVGGLASWFGVGLTTDVDATKAPPPTAAAPVLETGKVVDNDGGQKIALTRTVQVDHPLPVVDYLPWIPAFVQNKCDQTVTFHCETPKRIYIEERSVVNAIPWVTPVIAALWTVEEVEGHLECSVELSFSDCHVIFIQPLIEFYAQRELQAYFAAWQPHANAIITKRRDRGSQAITAPETSGPLCQPLWSHSSSSSGVAGKDALPVQAV